jgi:hypothetical protein
VINNQLIPAVHLVKRLDRIYTVGRLRRLCYALQDYLDSVRREHDAAEERAIDPRYQGNDDERARHYERDAED